MSTVVLLSSQKKNHIRSFRLYLDWIIRGDSSVYYYLISDSLSRPMSPTPTMTPSASMSAVFRPSLLSCACFCTKCVFTVLARDIYSPEQRRDVSVKEEGTTMRTSFVPHECGVNIQGSLQIVTRIGLVRQHSHSTGSRRRMSTFKLYAFSWARASVTRSLWRILARVGSNGIGLEPAMRYLL